MTMAPTSVLAVMAWAEEEFRETLTVALPTCAFALTCRTRCQERAA